ncbi:hypothetical protein EMCRGX_G008937 [Ephydatia muelleri]
MPAPAGPPEPRAPESTGAREINLLKVGDSGSITREGVGPTIIINAFGIIYKEDEVEEDEEIEDEVEEDEMGEIEDEVGEIEDEAVEDEDM